MSLTIEQVLYAATKYEEVAHALKAALSSELVVAHPYYRRIGEYLSTFLDEHNTLPKTGDFAMWADELAERDRVGVVEALGVIQRQTVSSYTPAAIVDHAAKVLSQAAAVHARAQLNLIPEDDLGPDALSRFAEDVAAVRPVSIEGLMDLSEWPRYAHEDPFEEGGWPSGSQRLDSYTGGFKAGELIFVLADTGIGKSTVLVNFGTAAVIHGANVFHITLELSSKANALRYYRRMVEADRALVRGEPEEFHSRLGHWWKLAKGQLHLLYRPAYATTPEELNQLVSLFTNLHGKPDIIILDYLDLLAPSPTVSRASKYERLGHASHFIRAIGAEHDACVLSAAQATRPRNKASFIESLSASQMGDSYEKVRAADVLLGLVQTPDEAAFHQARLQLLKVREAPRGADIPVFFYRDLMLLADLDHPNTRRLMLKYDIADWVTPEEAEEE